MADDTEKRPQPYRSVRMTPSFGFVITVIACLLTPAPQAAERPLKLRFGVAAFGAVNPLASVDVLAPIGFDYIEPALAQTTALDDAARAAAHAALTKARIPVETMNWFLPGTDIKVTGPDVDPAKVRAYVERALGVAESFGAKVIVFGSPGARTVPEGFPRERAWAQLTEFLRTCGDVITSRGYGMVIGIEGLRKPETN